MNTEHLSVTSIERAFPVQPAKLPFFPLQTAVLAYPVTESRNTCTDHNGQGKALFASND